MAWQDFNTVNPAVAYGKACIKGTRIPVAVVLANLAAGLSVAKIIRSYPSLTAESIQAALAYAAELAEEVHPNAADSPRAASRRQLFGTSGRRHGSPYMQYVIIETFRNGDAVPVYRRFRDHGRLAPDGLRYVASWVSQDFRRCYQVMECDDRALLDAWMAQWRDLVDFEVIPAMTSSEAATAIAPQL